MIIPQFILAGIVVLVPVWAPVAHAEQTITMSPSIWSYNQEVTITGNDLSGQYPRRKRLCTAPDAQQDKRTCFGSYDETNNIWNNDDDRIVKWESNEIIFRVPAGEPPQGVVILIRTYDRKTCYGSAGCNLLPEETATVVGSFQSRPSIDGIVELATDNFANELTAGREYEIRGKLFGPEKGSLLIGRNKTAGTGRQYQVWEPMPLADITRWDYNKIRFTASADIDLSTGLKVRNNVLESDPFVASATVSSASSSIASSSSSSQSAARPSFPDVPRNADYLSALTWAKDANIVSGYGDGTFKPDKPVNRAEYLKMVFLASGKQLATTQTNTAPFPDVRTDAWFAPFVQAAKAVNIVKGYGDGTFRPGETVSIAEGLKMGYLTFGISVPETGGQWYEPFLRHAVGNGVLRDPTAQVGQGMSRKDVVWMVWKLNSQPATAPQASAADPSLSSSSLSNAAGKPLNIGNITFTPYWTSWDADAAEDGFQVSPYFKDVNAVQVYPTVRDWTVSVRLFDAEVDYSKYGDFRAHNKGLVAEARFDRNEVKYEQLLGVPFVRVAREQFAALEPSKDWVIVEVEFSSPTYGTFSAEEEQTSSFRNR